MLTEEIKNSENRYDRQSRVAAIGQKGQQNLADSHVLIVGCGALGTYTAEQLARTGVGTLTVIDNDRVELTNLQRQSLFTENDIGEYKSLAALQHLTAINSTITIHAFTQRFEAFLFNDNFEKPDLILDCTDNFSVRHSINDYCLEAKIPFIFAAAAGTSGQAMAMKPSVGPCLNCVFPDLLDLESAGCETLGVVTPLIPLISSLQVSLTMQILSKEEFDDWTTLHFVESQRLSIQHFQVAKNQNCPICSAAETVKLPLTKTCGDVYQGFATSVSTDRLMTQGWQTRSNPLALLASQGNQSITAFKNGRLLFYGFDDLAAAEEVYQQL